MNYLPKVLLTTIFVTPFLLWTLYIIISQNDVMLIDITSLIVATVIGASVFSLPTFIIIWILYEWMKKKLLKDRTKRLVLSAVAIIGVLLTFSAIDTSMFKNLRSIIFPLSYCLIIFSSLWFYKIEENSGDQSSANIG